MAQAHAAEADGGNLEAAAAEHSGVHGISCCPGILETSCRAHLRHGLNRQGESALEPPLAQELHHRRIAMIEEQALAGVELADGVHVVAAQFETEDIEVLGDPLRLDRLRNDDDAALDQ